MSKETSKWLNLLTLIGFTAKRGNAWHYRAEDQGDEPNHYEGAIPVEDVVRRLFAWKAQEGPVSSVYTTPEGERIPVLDTERKAIIRPAGALGADDNGGILGLFKGGYQIHDYEQWLLDNISTLLDDDLYIASAGLLKQGGIAWVQVEVPDTITTPEGFAFRPFLTAATSLDGSLSSTYTTGAQAVVCDNTLSAAHGDSAGQIKIKHSAKSLKRVGEVRDALGIVYQTGDAFAAKVAELCAVEVTPAQWSQFLDLHVEMPTEQGRSRTLAENKRAVINGLYTHDDRVSPWAGTAFGVLQAINTFTHHAGTVRGGTHAERNAFRAITGGVDTLDAQTLATLNRVLVAA